ncbi:MAG: DUF4244 domain-containing protein [Actinomycetota bacterium]
MHSTGSKGIGRRAVRMQRGFGRLARWVAARSGDAAGQTTAEYALVILGAAAVGTLLITWATKSHAIGKLFDEVVGKILT